MKEHLLISSRGQITLPAPMRKSLRLGPNSVLTAESVGGKIILSPAVVLETETYPDAQIAAWDKDDRFAKGERERLHKKLRK